MVAGIEIIRFFVGLVQNSRPKWLCQELYSHPSQDGIFRGSQGVRLPQNLQASMEFVQQFTLFWREFDFKVFLYFPPKKGFFLLHTTCRKKHLGTASIDCHRKKYLFTERNFISRAEISSHKKKFLVTGRSFLSDA